MRRSSALAVGLLVALLACKRFDDRPLPALSSAPEATRDRRPPVATASPKLTFDLSGPRDAKGVDLVKILGTRADGWVLPPFAGIKKGMTPAEAGRVMRGGDKLDHDGVARIVPGLKGVEDYELHFHETDGTQRLQMYAVRFDHRLVDEPFWRALVIHLRDKLGPDMTDKGDHHVLWYAQDLTSWTLAKGFGENGYHLLIVP
jgi:hypothetical protein